MIKIILKIKNNKGLAPYGTKGSRSGFVILFAGTISAILLSIALGVANIAFKEVKFRTSDKETNAAFFAADVGVECALFYDRSDQNKFPADGPAMPITCANNLDIPVSFSAGVYNFTITNLGDLGQGCAKVTVDKTAPPMTTIISSGYNNGGNVPGSCVQGSNTVERQIELNY